jgi:hypothetical protein
MRRLLTIAACALALAAAAPAQELYTSADFGFELELPNQTWRALPRDEGSHRHAEFIYGDRSDGLLRVRKEIVAEADKLHDLADRDRDNKLRFLPGLVPGRREEFPGRLTGVSVPYEYTQAGKPWAARIYYLRADPRTVYVLHFTGRRDTLMRLRPQTDSIARSFRIK